MPCLLAWSDDIIVLDSYSSDRAVETARTAGVRVYQRRVDSERNQRTFGLGKHRLSTLRVYIPDADGITPPELRDEMLSIAATPFAPKRFPSSAKSISAPLRMGPIGFLESHIIHQFSIQVLKHATTGITRSPTAARRGQGSRISATASAETEPQVRPRSR